MPALGLAAAPSAAAAGPCLTSPVALNTNAGVDIGEDGNPDLQTDGAGTWIAAWRSGDDLGGGIGVDFDILFSRSLDDGDTWSDPLPLNTNAATDVETDWYPRLATDGAGTWIAVWHSLENLGGAIGADRDIFVARSTDGGATWTAPQALNANASTDVGQDWGPDIVSDGAGTWIVAWHSDEPSDDAGVDHDLWVARSTDGGLAWTAPATLNSNADADNGGDHFVDLATDGNGNWLAVWFSTDTLSETIGGDRDILAARSTDGGATWSAVQTVNNNAGVDEGADAYPEIVTNRAGTWIVVWQSVDTLGGTVAHDADIFVARSEDAGATWSGPDPLNGNAATDAGDDGGPQLAATANGEWLATWASVDPLDGSLGTDSDVLFARSFDGGASWTSPAALHANAALDAQDDGGGIPATDGAGLWITIWTSLEDLGGQLGPDADLLVSRMSEVRIEVAGSSPTEIRFVPAFAPLRFDVVTGRLSDLRSGNDFTTSECLGIFAANPATDESAPPPPGDGTYYLARGRGHCTAAGYGDSSLVPDPRDVLESAGPCP